MERGHKPEGTRWIFSAGSVRICCRKNFDWGRVEGAGGIFPIAEVARLSSGDFCIFQTQLFHICFFSNTSSRENPSGAFWFVFSSHFLPSFLLDIECLPPVYIISAISFSNVTSYHSFLITFSLPTSTNNRLWYRRERAFRSSLELEGIQWQCQEAFLCLLTLPTHSQKPVLEILSSFKLGGDSCLARAKRGNSRAHHALALYRVRPRFYFFLLIFLLRKVIPFSYSILPSARDPFLIRPAPLVHSYVILLYFRLRYGRQINYEYRIRV